MVKIYFAASIRGGRVDEGIYARIRELLLMHGELAHGETGSIEEVLAYDARLGSDKAIYESDIMRIKESDVLVAEVSVPSLGVGYEIAFAEKLGKKILCLYKGNNGGRLSAMISGNPNVVLLEYDGENDLEEKIKEFFQVVLNLV